MSFSVVIPAFLGEILAEGAGRTLAQDLGYSFGFVLVVLGRMQLFTENTITTVLPFLSRPSWRSFATIARLWVIVFAANVMGGAVAMWMAVHQLPTAELATMHELAESAVSGGFFENFMRGIPAGFLIAALVWLTRSTGHDALWIVVLITFSIALCGFAHVVAGSLEVCAILILDGIYRLDLLSTFVVPVFLGNVLGGTGLFTLVAYGQVKKELVPDTGG